jgi:hypothetical protein
MHNRKSTGLEGSNPLRPPASPVFQDPFIEPERRRHVDAGCAAQLEIWIASLLFGIAEIELHHSKERQAIGIALCLRCSIAGLRLRAVLEAEEQGP